MEWPVCARAAYTIYSALSTALCYPLVRLQAARQAWPDGLLQERVSRGLTSTRQNAGICLWVHAASVGESVSALKVVREFSRMTLVDKDRLDADLARGPMRAIMTVSNYSALRFVQDKIRTLESSGEAKVNVVVQLCPFDSTGCVRRFLDVHKPHILALIESELWPSMIYHASRNKMQLLFLDARMSSRSLRNWQSSGLSKCLLKALLSSFTLVLTPRKDRDVFIEHGVRECRLHIAPPLKFVEDLGSALGGDENQLLRNTTLACWAAVSTHQGEESLIVEAHEVACKILRERGVSESRRPRLILAPRHVTRIRDVWNDLHGVNVREGSSHEIEEWSADGSASQDIFLLNEMGKLGDVFDRSECVFVGNSLISNGNGHNILEPALAGCHVIHGCYMGESHVLLDWLNLAGSRCSVELSTQDAGKEALEPFRQVDSAIELGVAVAHFFEASEAARMKVRERGRAQAAAVGHLARAALHKALEQCMQRCVQDDPDTPAASRKGI
ncbi:putative 3-deoxy-D-manno-octulosonic acid transferase, mitochondrial [Porphyridium purpureum]|uniref:Putative 3-deoxy-D-manno-octulosonic acid transferase, mitochondrial n=1 Tax=Porphyridium purpureum TaxID=35688 RepID=A0A5J4Z348_PORPP|nr:putative 3-deoxy-D-manno-octulosonic acid transferase, mitochondrial [Porphyridium purpureum]|eukprot:POR7818..scf295_1